MDPKSDVIEKIKSVTHRFHESNVDIVQSYLNDASGELKELEDRINKCDNTDIINLSSDFRQSVIGASKMLDKYSISDAETVRLRGEILELEAKFDELVSNFEVKCICNKRTRKMM